MQKETCGLLIQQIHNILEKNANNQLRENGLTLSQMKVLMTLVDSPEKRLSFKELERQLALAQSTTLISRLEQKGLVSVTGDKEDKRIKYVEMSALGIDYCNHAEISMEEMERKLVSSLSEAERVEFLSMLKKVNQTLINH